MSGQTCLLLFMTVAQSAHQITSTDRVCQSFWASSWRVPNSHVEKVSAAMQVPFPELTELRLNLYDYDEWVSNGYQTASRPNPLRFVLGWIRSTSANFRADWHFVSGITGTTLVCHLPSSNLFFSNSLFPGTFRPRRWLLPSPHRSIL